MTLSEEFLRELVEFDGVYRALIMNSNFGEARRINDALYEFVWREYGRLRHGIRRQRRKGNAERTREDINFLVEKLFGYATRGYDLVWCCDINRDKEENT